MRLLFSADIYPTSTNIDYFNKGDVDYLFGQELMDVINFVDFRCYNVETPLVDEKHPVLKAGPNHIAPTSIINTLIKLTPDLITLGNNHIYDQGQNGVESTINLYRKNNIKYIGGGINREEAAKTFVYEKDGVKIGIYNCCEYESAAANEIHGGANLFDPYFTFQDIEELKASCDSLIVLFHGGREHYRYPTPMLQKKCQRFVDFGADLVICQHSHCIGCEEKYKNGTIVYGQGNFIFDRNINEFRKNGLFVIFEYNNGSGEVSYIPFARKNETIRLATEVEKDEILKEFYERSNQIKEKDFIQKKYTELVKKSYEKYVKKFLGRHLFIKILNKLTKGKIYSNYYTLEDASEIYNILTVEQHYGIIKEYLKERLELHNK